MTSQSHIIVVATTMGDTTPLTLAQQHMTRNYPSIPPQQVQRRRRVKFSWLRQVRHLISRSLTPREGLIVPNPYVFD
jgi:hypothetical protein